MRQVVLLDTGPLVALFNANDGHHQWAREQIAASPPPLVTCEAVLAEALHLLRRASAVQEMVLSMIERRLLRLPFRLEAEAEPINRLMRKYADVPMSLADACLVRMTELYPDSVVLTLDSDFAVYRRHGRQVVPAIRPD